MRSLAQVCIFQSTSIHKLRVFIQAAYVQVEKTPAVIKKGLKKEEAEALKAKLESGRATATAQCYLLLVGGCCSCLTSQDSNRTLLLLQWVARSV